MADSNPELKRARRAAEVELLNRPGVTGVDIGYKEVNGKPTDVIAIRVLVHNKRDVRPEDRIPETIGGFPTDVIQRRFEPQILTRDATDLVTQIDAKEYEQLKGGISIGPWRLVRGAALGGTLGLPVVDKTTGKPMLLSNYHVMCVDKSWSVGDVMTQPSRIDQGTNPNSIVASLQRGVLGDKVDCAVAEVTKRSIEYEIVDIDKVSGKTSVPTLGQTVRKRGRTTGLTFGIVDALDLTIIVNYGPDVGDVTLTNQIGVRPDTARNPKFSASGDSGSVVVNDAGDVVGLHCAGNSDEGYGVSNQIDAVLDALDVTICTDQPTNPDPRPADPVKRRRPPTLSHYPPQWPPRPPQTPYLLPYLPFPWDPRGSGSVDNNVGGSMSYYPPDPVCRPLHPVLGTWTYRSFVNNPDLEKDFNDLELGRGELKIEHFAPGIFVGRLSFGETYQFRLRGVVDMDPPCSVRFSGFGDTTDSKGQIYDYVGFFIPTWSNGVDQRGALVGSTVRSVAHNGGRAKAGMVGAFIALKRDSETE